MSYFDKQLILSKKEIDWQSEDFQRGVRYCLEELERLQDSFIHKRKWCISHNLHFAPIEIRDYLLLKARKDKEENSELTTIG